MDFFESLPLKGTTEFILNLYHLQIKKSRPRTFTEIAIICYTYSHMRKKLYSMELGGKTLTAEFNDLAKRAHGSALLKYGETVVLATVVMNPHPKDAGDFFPLTVDYEEKFYASGHILGSRFLRREGRPSDEATLSARIIDRTIRPLFPHGLRNEVQVVITVLSIGEDDPDVISIIAASLALGTSQISWNGPISSVRIGKRKNDKELLINPSFEWRQDSSKEFELIACGRDQKINMIEVFANEASEGALTETLDFAVKELQKIQDFQKKIIAEIGKPKSTFAETELALETRTLFTETISDKIPTALRNNEVDSLREEWFNLAKEKLPSVPKTLVLSHFETMIDGYVHSAAIEKSDRVDGRGMDEIRPMYAQAGGLSSIVHGSGIFYRGDTHVLSVLTLGGPGDYQMIDGIEEHQKKRFMHHYNFPPFSTGETGKVGVTNRRMIGHGMLAERALLPVIPDKKMFPYTIRIVSEALSSNGSTSMASVCGSTLALMDGGVPITKPVAGISIGLMTDGKSYKILTDIQGPEDHYGDMDFKVAGTKDGVTACQMDVKIDGIPLSILTEAFEKARNARLDILEKLREIIAKPRDSISPKAPRIIGFKIKTDQIGFLIGPGGKTINSIKEKSGVASIEIEEEGLVLITGKSSNTDVAKKMLEELLKKVN